MNIYISEVLIGIVAGLIGSIVGGGGLITLPFILSFVDSPVSAIGTNKMLACLTTIPSASVCVKKKLIRVSDWKYCIFFTIMGSFFGVLAIERTPVHFIKSYLPYFIITVCLYTALKKNNSNYHSKIRGDSHKYSTSILGLLLGFYDGLVGSGIGVIVTSIIIARYKVSLVEGVVISRLLCFFGNTTAFLVFAILGHINYRVGLIMGIAMSMGSFMGIHMALKLGHKFVRTILCVICVLMCFQLILHR